MRLLSCVAQVWRRLCAETPLRSGDPGPAGRAAHSVSGLPILSHFPLNGKHPSPNASYMQQSCQNRVSQRAKGPLNQPRHCETLRRAIARSFALRQSGPPACTRTLYIRDSAGRAPGRIDDPWRQGHTASLQRLCLLSIWGQHHLMAHNLTCMMVKARWNRSLRSRKEVDSAPQRCALAQQSRRATRERDG